MENTKRIELLKTISKDVKVDDDRIVCSYEFDTNTLEGKITDIRLCLDDIRISLVIYDDFIAVSGSKYENVNTTDKLNSLDFYTNIYNPKRCDDIEGEIIEHIKEFIERNNKRGN